MDLLYNTDYTKEDIWKYLDKMKKCVRSDNYTISFNSNRKENIDFIKEYNINSKRQKNMLLGIEVTDFCYSVKNKNKNYEHEELFIFVPQRYLFDIFGNKEYVDIYIKINLIEDNNKNEAIVISFHKKKVNRLPI